MTNKYTTGSGIVATKISSGRPHHTFRELVKATETYDYETSYGENFHTLATTVFGSDEYYWILADINPPKDIFDFEPSDRVKLPLGIVKQVAGTTKFF